MAKHRSKLMHILLYLVAAYGLILSVLIILWLITGESLFFVNIFVNTSPAVYYPLPFVVFLVFLLRNRRSFYFLLIPTIAFIFLYAPRFMPRSVESATGEELVLLTYNLQAGNHAYELLDGVLRRADADIVSLQEVNTDMADWLEENWSGEYPYFLAYSSPHDVSQYTGRFFMSRFPIQDYDMVTAPGITHLMYIRAELNISGQNVTVYNVHLPAPRYVPLFDTSIRSASMTAMLNSAPNDMPVLFMGDFNMTDQSSDYRRISSLYQDSFLTTSSGLGTSWPNARYASGFLSFMPSMIRIDYMFFSEEFIPQETHVLREGVSDHFPLWARVILKF